MSSESNYVFKILILGDSSVGKTCLLQKYVNDKFTTAHMPTIGLDFVTKQISVEGKSIKIYLWDTAGQERFRTLTHTLYNNVLGIVLCYSVDSRKSFESIGSWMKQIKSNVGDDVTISLVGNKNDLETKEIQSSEGQQLGQSYNVPFTETSAKLGNNIDQLFLEMAKRILINIKNNPSLYQQPDQAQQPQKLKADAQSTTKKSKKDGGCC